MKYLRITNWAEYQHYKDRNPPWVKLATDMFQKYEISQLPDASKLLAVCIITLASRYKDPKEGLVPDDIEWIKRQCNLGETITEKCLEDLVNIEFIERASNTLAECKQSARPETETETYYREDTHEKKKNKKTKKESFEVPEGINKQTWLDYEEMRNKIKKPMTDKARVLAIASLLKINREHGDDPNAVLKQSILNSWQGVFKLKNEARNGSNKQYSKQGGNRKSNAEKLEQGVARLAEKYGVTDY